MKPQTNGNNMEKHDVNAAFVCVSCFDLRSVAVSSPLTYLMFSSPQWTLGLFHRAVLHLAFIDTPSFLPPLSVESSLGVFSVCT